MNRDPVRRGRLSVWLRSVFALALLLGVLFAAQAGPFTLSVVDQNGASVPEFRWLLQEDTTIEVIPGVTDALSKGFHRSYAPVVAKGDQTTASISPPDPGKRYFLSVLPQAGYTMSGAPILPATGGTVTVRVHSHPIPTAQITVFVFEDNYPDQQRPRPAGRAGAGGLQGRLEDAGGRYGLSAGSQMMDAFGHPVGTVYGQDGHVVKMGDGVVTTDADGNALIKNLAPGKYSVIVPPRRGRTGTRPPPSRAPRSSTPGSRPTSRPSSSSSAPPVCTSSSAS